MKYYDKLIFEISKPGRIGYSLQQSDFGNYSLADLPQSLRRETEGKLPEASELDVVITNWLMLYPRFQVWQNLH